MATQLLIGGLIFARTCAAEPRPASEFLRLNCGLTPYQYSQIAAEAPRRYSEARWVFVCRRLKSAGLDPLTVLQAAPEVLGFEESFHEIVAGLTDLGLTQPREAIARAPRLLLSYRRGTLRAGVEALFEYGVARPADLLALSPQVAEDLSGTNVRVTLRDLETFGIVDPARFVAGFPEVLGMDVLTELPDLLSKLAEFGFADVFKLVNLESAVLRYMVDRSLTVRIARIRGIGVIKATEVIEASPHVLDPEAAGYKDLGDVPEIRGVLLFNKLLSLGFPDPERVLGRANADLRVAKASVVGERFQNLIELGFRDPVRLVLKDPNVLRMRATRVRRILAGLGEMGFADPKAIVWLAPKLLGFTIKNLRGKLARLEGEGLDAVALVTRRPSILELDFEDNILPKLLGFKELGVPNPHRMVSKAPKVLSYSFEKNLKPTFLELHEAWGIPAERFETRGDFLLQSISRIREMRAFLQDHGLNPSHLDQSIREALIIHHSAETLTKLLNEAGYQGLSQRSGALAKHLAQRRVASKMEPCESALAGE